MPLPAPGPDSLLRHIAACNDAALPGARVPFRISGQQIGWVRPAQFAGTAATQDAAGFHVPDAPALAILAAALAAGGRFRRRDELFDLRARPDGPVLAQLDRGALPLFGAVAEGVHLNGLVRRDGGLWMWVARRAANKLLDPNKLDHLVGGGIPAGLDAAATLRKEAAEEAGLPEALAQQAVPVAVLRYATERPEGLRRDRLHCFDLLLPDTFQPRPVDGEVAGFELWPLPRVLDAVRRTDAFKFNVSLVLIDLFVRHAMVGPDEAHALRAALDAGLG